MQELEASRLLSRSHSDDETAKFWVQRTFIDIYKQGASSSKSPSTPLTLRTGQINNRRPNMDASWEVNITLPILTSLSPRSFENATLALSINDTTVSFDKVTLKLLEPLEYTEGIPFSLTTTVAVAKDAVRVWYPINFGNPNLYTLSLTLHAAGATVSWTERIGFRTMYVNQEAVSKDQVKRGITPGTLFQFEINGNPFYTQGSRYVHWLCVQMGTNVPSSIIPFDTFPARVNTTTMRFLLESAALVSRFASSLSL